MGRSKGDPARSKTRPSSSSLAASFLQSSGGATIGFGGYVGGSRVDANLLAEGDSYMDINGEVAVHLRRLSKKDFITKLKALVALDDLFKNISSKDLSSVVPYWVFEYRKLVHDNNRQVRESTQKAMKTLVSGVGKGLAPHLRSVMGAWWVAQFDPCREVSDTAKASFQRVFSGQKRIEALLYCVDDIYAYLSDNLKSTPQTLSDKTTPLDESAEKHELVVCSSLLAMAAFLNVVFTATKVGLEETAQQSESSGDTLQNTNSVTLDVSALRSASLKIAREQKLFLNFVKSPSPLIRSAAYQTLRALVENISEAFTDGEIETSAKVVLGAFIEKDPSCHQCMWDIVLTFTKQFSEAWSFGPVKRVVLPRFWAFLRHGCYGSQQLSSQCLLPLLSLITAQAVVPVQEFFLNFFGSLVQGCKMSTSSNAIFLLRAFKECFIWIMKNMKRYVDEESEAETLKFFLINDILLKILWRNYFDSKMLNGHTTDATIETLDTNQVSSSIRGKGSMDIQVANPVAASCSPAVVPLEIVEGVKACLSDVLDFLARQEVEMEAQFWPLFQQDLIRILDAKLSTTPGNGDSSFSKMCEFFIWLGHAYNNHDADKTWPLENLVKPFIANTFQRIASLEDDEAIMLLASLVKIYGTEAFSSIELSFRHTRVEDSSASSPQNGGELASSNKEVEYSSHTNIADFLRNELIPWSLNVDHPVTYSKLELLLSFFRNGSFTMEWDDVLSYVLGEDEFERPADMKWIDLLASLVEHMCGKNHEDGCESQTAVASFDLWQSPKLDAAVLVAAQIGNLQHPPCAKLLRNAIGNPNILSTRAQAQVVDDLLDHILLLLLSSESSWARQSAGWILSQKKDAKSHQLKDIIPLAKLLKNAQFAVDILSNYLGSVLRVGEENNIQVRLLTALFCLKWTIDKPSAAGSMRNAPNDGFEVSETESEEGESTSIFEDALGQMVLDPAELGRSKENNLDAGSEYLAALSASLKFLEAEDFVSSCRRMSTKLRKSLQKSLAQCIRYALLGDSYLYCQSFLGCWALNILNTFCVDVEDVQVVLNLLLAEADGWPVWADVSSKEWKPVHFSETETLFRVEKMEISKRFASFVDALVAILGQQTIFLGRPAPSNRADLFDGLEETDLGSAYVRAWLVFELLCTWEWSGGDATRTVLPLLRLSSNHKHDSEVNALLFELMQFIYYGAIKSCEFVGNVSLEVVKGPDMNVVHAGEKLLQALLVLLRTLFDSSSSWGKPEAEGLFSKFFVQKESETLLTICGKNIGSKVLEILIPILRKKDGSAGVGTLGSSTSDENETDVETCVCQWLEMALSASFPLSTDKIETESIWWLKIAVSCFPLNFCGGAGTILAASTSEVTVREKSLLFALFQKQRLNVLDNSLSKGKVAETYIPALFSELILAKLIAAVIAYCWPKFEVEDWKFALLHLNKWLEAAVLDAEELAEAVAEAAREVEGANGLMAADYMKTSVESALSKGGRSSGELTGFAVGIFSEIQGLCNLEVGKEQELVLNLALASWERIEMRSLENILRLFFATSLAESAASFDSEAAEVISTNRVTHLQLWDSVADIALNSSARALEAAVRAADLWGVGKGSINALYSLLFSIHPISSLQWAAYRFLSNDSLRNFAITWSPLQVGLAESSESWSEQFLEEDVSTLSANIRPDLATVLEMSKAILLQSPLTSSSRVNYLVAWSLFLTHLQSLTPLAPARERLVQYTQDSEGPNILLDCLFQHISLKKLSSLSASRKQSSLSLKTSEVAEYARRAAATGSVHFAVEGLWPVKKKEMAILSGAIYGLILRVLPARVRLWFTGLRDRSFVSAVESFTSLFCSPELLTEEFLKVHAVSITDENLSIRANHSTREVTALYKKEEAGIDIVIKLPACYPLRAVEVECTRRMGISENRLRKWILSMAAFLRNQNGAVAEAILVWKRNVDREFEGVEECPICYSIIHTSNHSLPRLACRTCKHKFHPACLYKWFSTSHKSTCPLCQTPF